MASNRQLLRALAFYQPLSRCRTLTSATSHRLQLPLVNRIYQNNINPLVSSCLQEGSTFYNFVPALMAGILGMGMVDVVYADSEEANPKDPLPPESPVTPSRGSEWRICSGVKSGVAWQLTLTHSIKPNEVDIKSVENATETNSNTGDLDHYTIKGTNKIVRVGDCVLLRLSEAGKRPHVARVEKIKADSRGNVNVRVRWYYRPEESMSGRRSFHGWKELFLSDHSDVQSAHTIEGKCRVHTFKSYTKLDNIGADDYFCRFEYNTVTGAFVPDTVAVYCKCELPYNPDELMVPCEGCKDWFHPACVGMSFEEAKQLDQFVCSDCASDDVNKADTSSLSENDSEPVPKRLKR